MVFFLCFWLLKMAWNFINVFVCKLLSNFDLPYFGQINMADFLTRSCWHQLVQRKIWMFALLMMMMLRKLRQFWGCCLFGIWCCICSRSYHAQINWKGLWVTSCFIPIFYWLHHYSLVPLARTITRNKVCSTHVRGKIKRS